MFYIVTGFRYTLGQRMSATLDKKKFLGINSERCLTLFLFSEFKIDFIVPYPRERKKISILKIGLLITYNIFVNRRVSWFQNVILSQEA